MALSSHFICALGFSSLRQRNSHPQDRRESEGKAARLSSDCSEVNSLLFFHSSSSLLSSFSPLLSFSSPSLPFSPSCLLLSSSSPSLLSPESVSSSTLDPIALLSGVEGPLFPALSSRLVTRVTHHYHSPGPAVVSKQTNIQLFFTVATANSMKFTILNPVTPHSRNRAR